MMNLALRHTLGRKDSSAPHNLQTARRSRWIVPDQLSTWPGPRGAALVRCSPTNEDIARGSWQTSLQFSETANQQQHRDHRALVDDQQSTVERVSRRALKPKALGVELSSSRWIGLWPPFAGAPVHALWRRAAVGAHKEKAFTFFAARKLRRIEFHKSVVLPTPGPTGGSP